MASALPLAAALALLGSAGPAPAQVSAAGEPGPFPAADYREVHDAFVSARPDPRRVATLSAPVSLLREGMHLLMEEGTVALLEPVRGRVVGFAFSGRGRLRVAPHPRIERDHLRRILGVEMVDVEIDRAAVYFTDSTLEELEAFLTFGPGDVGRRLREVVEDALDYLVDEGGTPPSAVMKAFLNGADDQLFHAHVDASSGDDLVYRYDDWAREEVMFGRDSKRRGDRYEVLSRFHRRDDYAAEARREDDERVVAHLDHYEVETTIGEDLRMRFHARVRVVPRLAGPSWLPLALYRELAVDSVGWRGSGGAPGAAAFHRAEDSGLLWVRLPEDARPEEPRILHLWYGGELVDVEQGWYGLESSTGWYPTSGARNATFDLTFRTPERYELAAAGELTSREDDGDVVVTRWVISEPAHHASFNVGRFEEHRIEDPRVPAVTVQIQRGGHNRLPPHILQQRNMGEQVGTDVVNALAFFQALFGPIPAPHFTATEIPGYHGQAFPGLIHLSWVTYLWTRQEGWDEEFRAHEVAHQWWGLGVAPLTYHDEWITEGLSEFCGLWYMQLARGDETLYHQRLDDYREEILDRRGRAGPVWLGRRLITRDTEDDYRIIAYQKGAWIFHMLRILAMDLQTGDESVFTGALRILHERDRGRRITTEELWAHLETAFGTDLDWFFRQWVYGTAVPRYRVSWTGREEEGGGYRMALRVVQEEVPEDFVAYVPLMLDFGEEGLARLRLRVGAGEEVFDLPPLPREPEDVVFNFLEGVLAEVETEDWDGPPPW